MILDFVLWYLLISLTGWLAFPLAYRLLPCLPDRGYTLTRPLGLLLWGGVFWLLATLRIVENGPGGILLALASLAALSAWAMKGKDWNEIFAWLKGQKRLILIGESLFLLAFAGWAVVRAFDPAIAGTEKPMEMAFINAILRSPAFPPHDPWLSGYAISYYYLGYVLVTMLTSLTGVYSGIAFNLAISLWFALTALAAYGLLYSLLAARSAGRDEGEDGDAPSQDRQTSHLWALLAPLFILIVSNLEGFLEVLHSGGLFWRQSADGSWFSPFWSWLNIKELSQPPTLPFTWLPERVTGIWWWRASRVLQDFDLLGGEKEVIDEFPFFSYYLGDLHPHLLAMPFVLLAIGLALHFYLRGMRSANRGLGILEWLAFSQREARESRPQGGLLSQAVHFYRALRLHSGSLALAAWLDAKSFWLAAAVLGALAPLNIWDFPIYVALFCSVYVWLRYRNLGWSSRRLVEFVELGAALGVCGFLLYLPFYPGFASQAGGFLPSLSFFTRGVHFWVMFGSLLLPLLVWLGWYSRGKIKGAHLKAGLKFSLWTSGGLWVLSFLAGWMIANLDVLGNLILALGQGSPGASQFGLSLINMSGMFFALHGAGSVGHLLGESLARRLAQPGAWLTLVVLVTILWGSLSAGRRQQADGDALSALEETGQGASVRQENRAPFVLLLALMGCGLALAPEFFYLRDQFGTRMNMIFKFYFQVWIVWGLAAAYASVVLWRALRGSAGALFRAAWLLLMALALIYPIYGLWWKASGTRPADLTLDGAAYLARFSEDELEAIHWLKEAPLGVVAEAIGGSYTGYGRVSTFSGQPTVLGWPGHESQWRGGAAEMGSRESDIQALYRTGDWQEAKMILDRYQIRYVYVGSLENAHYRPNVRKFDHRLPVAFQNDAVTIYEVPGVEMIQ